VSLTVSGLVVALLVILSVSAVFVLFDNRGTTATQPESEEETPTQIDDTPRDTEAPLSAPPDSATVTPAVTSTPVVTVEPTSTSTQTPTATQTPSPSPTETPAQDAYYEFAMEYFDRLHYYSPVPLRLRGVEVRDGVMWVVVNNTAPSENRSLLRSERNSIANSYARTYEVHEAGNIDGDRPKKLRYIEANSASNSSPKTYTVNNSLVEEYVYGERSAVWYNDVWRDSLRNATISEIDTATQIDRAAENNTFAQPDG